MSHIFVLTGWSLLDSAHRCCLTTGPLAMSKMDRCVCRMSKREWALKPTLHAHPPEFEGGQPCTWHKVKQPPAQHPGTPDSSGDIPRVGIHREGCPLVLQSVSEIIHTNVWQIFHGIIVSSRAVRLLLCKCQSTSLMGIQLVPVIAWCHEAPSHYPSQFWPEVLKQILCKKKIVIIIPSSRRRMCHETKVCCRRCFPSRQQGGPSPHHRLWWVC